MVSAGLCRKGLNLGCAAKPLQAGAVPLRVPRYFFNIHDGIVTLDEEGRDLPDAEAAKAEAIAGGRDLMCGQLRDGHLDLRHRIEVMDEQGNRVAVVPYGEMITLES